MAACPVALTPLARRRPFALTQPRLEANRRNARRSTGPRTAQGKARVARNPIKHGFFVAQQRWTPAQHRDYEALVDGFRDDFRPHGALEESCVRTLAESYVRMAAALRYENIAALKHHEERDRELDRQIAAAAPSDAAWLEARRERLRRAGLWTATIPGERDAIAITRYLGRLDRTIASALSQLNRQKQTHFPAAPDSGPEALRRASAQRFEVSASPGSGPEAPRRAYTQRFEALKPAAEVQKQTHYSASPNSGPEVRRGAYAQRFNDSAPPNSGPDAPEPLDVGALTEPSSEGKNAKTNPLSSMFPGNRHERRRAKALARRG